MRAGKETPVWLNPKKHNASGMQTLPSQPNTSRGTLILLAPNAKDANISASNVYFTFQYNPEKLIHTFNQANPNAAANTSTDQQAVPSEFFNLTFELDSIDIDPSSQDQSSANLGLHPALAMLELMIQPQVVGKQTFLPIVVFKWGAKRSVAVRLVGMSVEEKSFDEILNPTRATVTLTLRVLDATEINNNQGARNVYSSHQNTRASLVGAYVLQTGQGTVMGASGASGLSASAGMAASAGESKQKVCA
jgi:Contractile injection system tube protein